MDIRSLKNLSVMAQSSGPLPPVDVELDISREICPMTFVRTRLALDRMAKGQVLRVRLRGDEPRRNVPTTAAAQGHEVLAVEAAAGGVSLVVIRKG
jgi:tRNA 2-thiouridine synthesizing protein A